MKIEAIFDEIRSLPEVCQRVKKLESAFFALDLRSGSSLRLVASPSQTGRCSLSYQEYTFVDGDIGRSSSVRDENSEPIVAKTLTNNSVNYSEIVVGANESGELIEIYVYESVDRIDSQEQPFNPLVVTDGAGQIRRRSIYYNFALDLGIEY